MAVNIEPQQKKLIFVFVDGVGIGDPNPDKNPFYYIKSPLLPFFAPRPSALEIDHLSLKAIDAHFDTPGTPQSGSGQTSLFCGIPYPRLAGEHGASYPNRDMRHLLYEHNLLKTLITQGIPARFFNAYPFHAHLFAPPHLLLDADGSLHFSQEFPVLFRRRISATSVMMLSTGQAVTNEVDLQNGLALYQDFTNRSLISRGADLPLLTPTQAGTILAKQSRTHPGLTLFEYFLTDQTGHRGKMADAVTLLSELEAFLAALIASLDPHQHTVLICSDHGNIEEMDHTGHSHNPVPLWVWGHDRQLIFDRVSDLSDIKPAIVHFFA